MARRKEERGWRAAQRHGGCETAVLNDSSLKSAKTKVEIFKGVLQLSGFVHSLADIDRAVEVARGVAGVESVKNDMRLE